MAAVIAQAAHARYSRDVMAERRASRIARQNSNGAAGKCAASALRLRVTNVTGAERPVIGEQPAFMPNNVKKTLLPQQARRELSYRHNGEYAKRRRWRCYERCALTLLSIATQTKRANVMRYVEYSRSPASESRRVTGENGVMRLAAG